MNSKLQVLTLSLFLSVPTIQAATVAITQGALTIDYTNPGGLFLSNPNHFDQALSNSSTNTYIENNANSGTTQSNVGLEFLVNSGSPSSPAGRAIQGTTMTYDTASLTSTITGQAGFGGVTRWDYGFGGGFLIGDYTLEYDALRAVGAKSGWYLENHYTFGMIAWDLANVITSIDGDNFTLSGDLFVAPELATNFGAFSDGSLVAGADYGNFSFTSAPEPSRSLLLLIGLVGAASRRRRKNGALCI